MYYFLYQTCLNKVWAKNNCRFKSFTGFRYDCISLYLTCGSIPRVVEYNKKKNQDQSALDLNCQKEPSPLTFLSSANRNFLRHSQFWFLVFCINWCAWGELVFIVPPRSLAQVRMPTKRYRVALLLDYSSDNSSTRFGYCMGHTTS